MSFQCVIFDLGGVLVDIDFEGSVRRIAELSGLSSESVREIFTTRFTGPNFSPAERYELGHIDSPSFFAEVHKLLGGKISRSDLERERLSLLVAEKHDTSEVLKSLQGKVRTACFSNTSDQHWRHMHEHYSFMPLFESCFASHILGKAKPNIDAFQEVLDGLELEARNCIFVDDSPKNIQGAREAGLHALHFNSASELKDQLADIL
jgi:putative hydrolase of the HAD superfamily